MTSYVPPGWPAGVHPPGDPEFERSATAWLLGAVPPDYMLHGVLKRHPIALATLARHHLSACVDGARKGYRSARSELGPHLPPGAVEAVLTAYRSEGLRLAEAARAADLVERALRGETFVRQMSGGRATRNARGQGDQGNQGDQGEDPRARRTATERDPPGRAQPPDEQPPRDQPPRDPPRYQQPRDRPPRDQPPRKQPPRDRQPRDQPPAGRLPRQR